MKLNDDEDRPLKKNKMMETKRKSKCSWAVELEVQNMNNQLVGLDMEEHEMGSKLQPHDHLFSSSLQPPPSAWYQVGIQHIVE